MKVENYGKKINLEKQISFYSSMIELILERPSLLADEEDIMDEIETYLFSKLEDKNIEYKSLMNNTK